jgi:uncharacterized protein (DUF2267 family)
LIKKLDLGSSRNEEVQKNACEITHLPNELMECILLKLSYGEIAQVRLVCRRFRGFADGILDREFRCLQTRAESHLAALVQEENASLGNPVQSGTNSTGRRNPWVGLPKSAPQQEEMDSRKLLNVICNKMRLRRAVCYRLLYLSEVPQNIRYSSAYFKAEIIDEVHFILRLLRSRPIGRENTKVDLRRFNRLVSQWIYLFYKEINPTSIEDICAQIKSECRDLFGSKVIDLLECISDCEKDITVNIDEKGWCYVKGEYKACVRFIYFPPTGAIGLDSYIILYNVGGLDRF